MSVFFSVDASQADTSEDAAAQRVSSDTAESMPSRPEAAWFSRLPFLVVPAAVLVLLFLYRRAMTDPLWIPVHDTLTQFTEYLYALSAYRQGELPLWNSYLYGGQPFYLMLSHGLLLNPICWLWIVAGSFAGLSPRLVFIAYHLTEVIFFAAGGLYFVRELTRSSFAGLCMFVILLFCGESAYWITQVYSLSIVEYVPWVLLFALRYFRRQTAGRAALAVSVLAISMNVYYPAYLFAFLVTLLILLLLLRRDVLRKVDCRLLFLHSAIVMPLAALLVLPTYWLYHEITSDYFQIARYAGSDQAERLVAQPAFSMTALYAMVRDIVRDFFITPATDYGDTPPLVGIFALGLALYEAVFCSRRGLLWLLAGIAMALNYFGRSTPFYDFMKYVSPFYSVIGASVFFSGFVVFCLAVASALGARRLMLSCLRRPFPARTFKSLSSELPVVAMLLLLAAFAPAGQRMVPLIIAVCLLVLSWLARRTAALITFSRRNVYFQLAFLSLLLLAGASYLHRTNDRVYHNWKSDMFTYSSEFHFSPVRPETFTVRQPLGEGFSGECCITNYHIAEKTDGPFYFFNWGSLHTLFVSRDYYKQVFMPGFDSLMRSKFHWYAGYAVRTPSGPPDPNTLILEDDAHVRNRGSGSLQAVSEPGVRDNGLPEASVVALRKTANRLLVRTTTARDMFLLYTDAYNKGFKARIDGREVPVLKAMGVLKAVEVPAGEHTIEFSFEPAYRFVLAGYLIVAIGVFCYLVVWSAKRLFACDMVS